MPHIGFVTAQFLDGLFSDDALAARELEARGCTVTPLVWNTEFDARAFDALVIRSPWDWYKHRPAFRAFLASLASAPVRVFNPPAMLERYADKTSFRHLDTLGVDTIPTAFFTPARLDEVPRVLAERGWRRAVLKPSFTANAYGAQRFEAAQVLRVVEEAKQHEVDSEWMLQPYVESIEREGEWSLVFFSGAFSHAVRKQPKDGDFRVQPDHGGSSGLAEVPASLVEAAQRVVDVAVPDALYARVDGVVHDLHFRVMELEVVEPELFFRFHPEAPARFANALLSRLHPSR
jgi:glutathione synthase/RimK-type ligase-like ATP-grasp enzyme